MRLSQTFSREPVMSVMWSRRICTLQLVEMKYTAHPGSFQLNKAIQIAELLHTSSFPVPGQSPDLSTESSFSDEKSAHSSSPLAAFLGVLLPCGKHDQLSEPKTS